MINITDMNALRIALGFVSTDETQHKSIRGVHFTSEGAIIATDGYILFYCPDVTSTPPKEPTTIIFSRKLPLKAMSANIDTENGTVTTDKGSKDVITMLTEPYVDYKKYVNKEWEGVGVLCTSGEVLGKLVKAIGKRTIRFTPQTSESDVIKVEIGEKPEAQVVLMPARF